MRGIIVISDQIKGQIAVAGTDVYGASGNDVIWFIMNDFADMALKIFY